MAKRATWRALARSTQIGVANSACGCLRNFRDRLVMLLTGAESIRDVILFPLLKPKR